MQTVNRELSTVSSAPSVLIVTGPTAPRITIEHKNIKER